MKNKILALGIVAASALSASAQTADVGDIVTAASTTFTAVAALCVTIGTFFIGYRLAKRAR